MPATLMDDIRPLASTRIAPPSADTPGPMLPVTGVPRRPQPSRRRRRVAGRLSRLVALVAMLAWVVVGLMPVAAVLLAVYGS